MVRYAGTPGFAMALGPVDEPNGEGVDVSHLAQRDVDRVRAAAEAAGLGSPELRRLLFDGIPPTFVAKLPVFPEPRFQLMSDLSRMNRAGPLPEGTVPLEKWLRNAVVLVSGEAAEATLNEVLRRMGPPPGRERGGSSPAGDLGEPDPHARTRPVLVSHVDADEPWAVWIAWQLEQAGYPVTVRAWDNVPGDNWASRVDRLLTDGSLVLAVVSADYLGSSAVTVEWQTAWGEESDARCRRVVPVLVERVRPPGFLGGLAAIDLTVRTEGEARRTLVAAMRARALGHRRPDDAPPFPGAATRGGGAVSAGPPFPARP
jgi:hypothetical protein